MPEGPQKFTDIPFATKYKSDKFGQFSANEVVISDVLNLGFHTVTTGKNEIFSSNIPSHKPVLFYDKFRKRFGGENILVYIHGFENSFENAIGTCSFFDKNYKLSSQNMIVVPMIWPSRGALLKFVKSQFGEVPAYRGDRLNAQISARDLAGFLQTLMLEPPDGLKRRLVLIAHSMGAFALRFILEQINETLLATDQRIDTTILVAPDEDSDAFQRLEGYKKLLRISKETWIYYNKVDSVLSFGSSGIMGNSSRLGQAPEFLQHDDLYYVDCTTVSDPTGNNSLLDRHDYHRQSPKVIADVADCIAGVPVGKRALKKDTAKGRFKIT